MKTIHELEILVYHDGAQVLTGRDADCGLHLGVRVAGGETHFLFRDVSQAALDAFLSGTSDLRDTLLAGGGEGWYWSVAPASADSPLVLRRQDPLWDAGPHLPDPGFILSPVHPSLSA